VRSNVGWSTCTLESGGLNLDGYRNLVGDDVEHRRSGLRLVDELAKLLGWCVALTVNRTVMFW
jgi:hypothetical protein